MLALRVSGTAVYWSAMTPGNFVRVVAVLAAVAAAAGSASSSSNQNASMMTPQGQQQGAGAPPPQAMEPARALGLWSSTFGAVKIEADNSKGGLQTGAVQGVWVYQRQGQEVVGYFSGNLRGNVLQFRWQEPNDPPLTGEGYLVFDVQGRQYSGRWWSDRRDRVGDWNGWRQAGPEAGREAGQEAGQSGQSGDPWQSGDGQPRSGEQDPYGGQTDGQPPAPYQQPGPYRQPPPPQPQPQQPPPRTYY